MKGIMWRGEHGWYVLAVEGMGAYQMDSDCFDQREGALITFTCDSRGFISQDAWDYANVK